MRHADPGGHGTQAAHDFVVRFGRAVSSALGTPGDVRLDVEGSGGLDQSVPANTEGAGERAADSELFTALGMVGRPLPPQLVGQAALHTEVMCLITADGLVPFATRDLRLKMGGNGPTPGTLAFVGYGGGFHSQSPVPGNGDPAGGGTLHVLYCPYAYNAAGVPQKAHAVILDPTPGNESVQVIHADGMAVVMSAAGKKPLLLKNAAGDATLWLDDDGVHVTCTTMVVSGGLIVGDPATAVPLLPGPASPGSSKFWVSP